MRKWLKRSLFVLLVLAGILAAGWANRVPNLPVPASIVKRTEKILLQGATQHVDLYLPNDAQNAPVVIVAHGFSRHRRVMAGWGILLAQNGMIAVVPTLPAFADQARNIRAIHDLIALVHEPGLFGQTTPNGDVALMGHSAGGFDTLIALTGEKRVRCWIGLDPVDFGDHGLRCAKSLKIPSLMLLAESGAWNRYANTLPWITANPSSLTALRIIGSSHCDPENPTSRLANLVCGQTDPERRTVYERYAVAMLRKTLFGDQTAGKTLAGASSDPLVQVLK